MTRDDDNLAGMVGRHPVMREVYRLVRRAAATRLPVVIEGETGTGKELVARALHELGPTPGGPFADINCATIQESLAEGELFGWERGAFTGAVRSAAGLLAHAHGGTLFLDEVCSLSLAVQAKLLRAIERGESRRVGGARQQVAAFRLVAAASQPVASLVASGRMREDFVYRILGITIALPPLRSRLTDIEALVEYFLRTSNGNGHPAKVLDAAAVALLRRQKWPGNVRELRMVVERSAVLAEARTITLADLMDTLPQRGACLPSREDLVAAVDASGGHMGRAARSLGIGRTKFYRLLRLHGLSGPRVVPANNRVVPGNNGAQDAHPQSPIVSMT